MNEKECCCTPDELAAVYSAHATAIERFFVRHTGNPHEAEDLAATTFSRALASLERYEERGRFVGWLWSIARHVLHDAQRRRRASVDLAAVAPLLADPTPSPEHAALQAEQARQMRALLSALPADQRAAILLRFWGDMSLAEIADVLGRSTGAVKMLLQRGQATLRARVRETEHLIDLIVALFRPQPVPCRALVPVVGQKCTTRRY